MNHEKQQELFKIESFIKIGKVVQKLLKKIILKKDFFNYFLNKF